MSLSKLIGGILLLAAAVFAALIWYPQALLGVKTEEGNFTFYSAAPLTGDVKTLVFKVNSRLSNAQFYSPSEKFTFYIADSFGTFSLIAPWARGDFFAVFPPTGHIVMAGADFDKLTASRDAETDNSRKLEGALVHAAVYELTRRGMGWLTYHFSKSWKKDGYAISLADESFGFYTASVCGKDPDSLFLKWYENRLGVEYMMREEKLGYRGILQFNRSYDLLRKDVRQRHCPRN